MPTDPDRRAPRAIDSVDSAIGPAGPKPLLFRLAKWLIRTRRRGGYRLLGFARQCGWLDRTVAYDLGDNIRFHVPINRPDTAWDLADVLAYDPPLIEDMVAASRSMARPRILVDCGADIGTVTALYVAAFPEVDRIYAFEPNASAFPALQRNMDALPVSAKAIRAAVGAAPGRGRLRKPEHSTSDHAQFVEVSEDGAFDILTVDSLNIGADASVILKIDVEGGEGAVLAGAANTLRNARSFVVIFETQLDQHRRTGEEAIDLLKAVNAIRPCVFHCCDVRDLEISLDKPFFDQVRDPNHGGYNILCRSID